MNPSAFDVSRARRETPGCENVLHFNNAGASLMPAPVLEAVTGHLRLESEIGGYEAAEKADRAVENAYDSISRLIGCSRDEVALIENATRAWDMAFYSLGFKPGDKILTCVAEYGSNYIAFLQVARKTGAEIVVIPDDETGQVSIQALQEMMDDKVKLIAITHVPTNGGLVNPAEEIGGVAREAGVPYLLDACQSVGQMPVNVEEIGCDILSATSRKYLRGPRGAGFLYVRRSVLNRLDPPFLDLHAATWTAKDRYEIRPDARRFENWESYVAGKIGLAAAVDYALSWGMENICARVSSLAGMLRDRLAKIPGVEVRDRGEKKCGIVSFTFAGRQPDDIRSALALKKINVSISWAEATRLDMDRRGLESVVRASVHYYNTEEEIERFCQELSEL